MSWLDRQSFLGSDSDIVLSQAKVGIIGLGGGGSHVAQQFAHAGVGSFVLVDPDSIEDTNLNRLVGGTWADVKALVPKVQIAQRLIQGVRPSAAVLPLQVEWQTVGDSLKLCDVIVGGLDSVRAKDELDAFCRRFLIPYIDMGMDVHGKAGDFLIAGQVVLSFAGSPCLRCLELVTDEALSREGQAYGAAGGRPQVVWPNGVLASTAVGLAIQVLTPWHSSPLAGAHLEYDGNTGSLTQSYRFAPASKKGCPHYPPSGRGDPLFDVRQILHVASPAENAPPQIDQTPIGLLRRLKNWLR